MGLFDYIKCEYPLPIGQEREYQTKDTYAQHMERYTITVDGRLIHHSVRHEGVPLKDRPYPNAKIGSFQSICGIMRSVPTGDVEIPHHGDIYFYDHDLEWQARFTNGRIEWIRRIEETTDAAVGVNNEEE